MEVFRTIQDYTFWRTQNQRKAPIGLVPTMGALHDGHVSLIRESVKQNRCTVVSIFVNPLQFGPGEDFSAYPRNLTEDLKICRQAGVSAVLVPQENLFSANHKTFCEVEHLDKNLCGAKRPGHFRGVCTVVMKIFNITKPDRAYFGQKDIQQALILKRMIEELSVDVEMVLVPTVREKGGLALSSRNQYLSEDEKQRANHIFHALQTAKNAFLAGEKDTWKLRSIIMQILKESKPTSIDYVSIVDQENLQPVEMVTGPAIMAIAAYYGKARLIDNIILD